MDLEHFVCSLPKAELHVHIEGTLEPEMMFELARRNGVALPWKSVEETRAAYAFTDLQSFLDLYYAGAAALIHERDFFELALAYFERAHADGVVHAECSSTRRPTPHAVSPLPPSWMAWSVPAPRPRCAGGSVRGSSSASCVI